MLGYFYKNKHYLILYAILFIKKNIMENIIQAKNYLKSLENQNIQNIILKNFGLKNILTELPELLHFKAITALDLSNNKITNLDFLKYFPNLTYLNLEFNQIQSLKALTYVKNLNTLRLHKNNIKTISFLKQLDKLEFLAVSENKINDIEAIKYLKKLKVFDAWNNKITTINPLCEAEALVAASLQFNDIGEIPEAIKQLTNLKELYLAENAFMVDDYENLLIDWLPNTYLSFYEDEF